MNCASKRIVTAPIRYGKKTRKRGNTYTMVLARSCSEAAKLGRALVAPVLATCDKPEHLFREAECLWAAERDVEQIEGICADWGKVCVLKNPRVDARDPILQSWSARVAEARPAYTALTAAAGEEPVLDPATGLALFDWPTDLATNEALTDFDLLLMTANKPTLIGHQYPSVGQIASAWRDDPANNVMYFYNNRYCGITTFEDEAVQAILRGDQRAAHPTAGSPQESQ